MLNAVEKLKTEIFIIVKLTKAKLSKFHYFYPTASVI